MKVALWAEIRRLSEIEKLSGWAIARRLHCSRHTVAAALKLEQPPSSPAAQRARRASVLDPYVEQIKKLLAKSPDLSAVRIREEIAQARRRDGVRFIVLDAAVMLEAGWNDVSDKLIFVDTPRALRLERVRKKRGWSEVDLQARENLQMPLDEKRRRADAALDNASTLDALHAKVAALVQRWGL